MDQYQDFSMFTVHSHRVTSWQTLEINCPKIKNHAKQNLFAVVLNLFNMNWGPQMRDVSYARTMGLYTTVQSMLQGAARDISWFIFTSFHSNTIL